MALTPEDVVNKRFQPTKFREGYDQDEVDDFLDEVVVELRRLNQENEELRQRVNQLQQAGPQQAAPVAVAAAMAPPAAPPVAAPQQVPGAYPSSGLEDQGNTNNLLQLARTLHEQHVREGVEKRDALIAEGHATAARVVQEAEAQQRAQIGGLEQERQQLEQERQQLEFRIEELRNFERDYRAKLKGYIEGQLRDLDAASVAAPQAPPQQAAPQQAAPPQSPLLTGQQSPLLTGQQSPLQTGQQAPLQTGQQSPLLTGQQPPSPFLTGQQPPAPAYGAAPPQPQVPQGYPGFGGN
jgi:DivIVA domain-containing protein